jgi:hypothetical protein
VGNDNHALNRLLARDDEVFQALTTAQTGRIQIGISKTHPVQ